MKTPQISARDFIENFDSLSAAARALNVSRPTLHKWRDENVLIPDPWAYKAEVLLGGLSGGLADSGIPE